jgi:WD40 repeat protein
LLPVESIIFRPDGRSLLTVDMGGTLKEWPRADPGFLPFPGPRAVGGQGAVVLSGDGRRLALLHGAIGPHPDAAELHPLEVRDAATGARLLTRRVSMASLKQMDLDGGGRRLALWWSERPFLGHPGALPSLGLALGGMPAGAGLFANAWFLGLLAAYDRVEVIDVESGREVMVREGLGGALRLSPDGRSLLVGGNPVHRRGVLPFGGFAPPAEGPWALVDVDTGRERFRGAGGPQAVHAAAFHPAGRLLAVWSIDPPRMTGFSVLTLWDLETGQIIAERPVPQRDGPGRLLDLQYSADGQRLVGCTSGQKGRTLLVWDGTTGQETLRTGLKDVLTLDLLGSGSFELDPDGRSLAYADHTSTIRVVDLLTGEERQTLRGHPNGVTAWRFSPDGRRLASLGAPGLGSTTGGDLRVWDLAMGQDLLSLPQPWHGPGAPLLHFAGQRLTLINSWGIRVLDGTPGAPSRARSAAE